MNIIVNRICRHTDPQARRRLYVRSSLIARLSAFVTGSLLAAVLSLLPMKALGCACGCGVFDVGTSSMFPTGAGGMVYVEEDYMDQDKDYTDQHSAPASDNTDKELRTEFYTAGAQYMFNRSWGMMGEIPYWNRYFQTDVSTTSKPDIIDLKHAALGDIRLKGIYTGLSPDMSTGLTFGVKLPTGDHSYFDDADSEISSGSTDLLLGAYHTAVFASNPKLYWFVNGQADLTVMHLPEYRPGSELDMAAGVYYHGVIVGKYVLVPLAQLIGSYRYRDGLAEADPADSGYQRVLVAPGVEVHAGAYHVYTDIGFPVYQDMRGYQLVARALFKLNISKYF